ncbi:MAG: FeoA family protein, partial [Halobacteriota archaeon]
VEDEEPEVLDFLEDRGVVPGAEAVVDEVAPFGMVSLSLDGGRVSLPREAAGVVAVEVTTG